MRALGRIEVILYVAIIVGGIGLMIFTRGRTALRLRDRIRKMFPDARLVINGMRFTYKGLNARLNWHYSTKNTRAFTYFELEFPEELRRELTDVRLKVLIDCSGGHSARSPLEDVRQRCTLKTGNPIMQGLLTDRAFLSAASALDGLNKCLMTLRLRKDSFDVELDDVTLTKPKEMAGFTKSCLQLFDRILSAAAAVNPAILSTPPIAGNFTVKPGEFLNACSDEDMYDSLEDMSPTNSQYHHSGAARGGWGEVDSYDDSETWEADDSRALPQEGAKGYDAADDEYEDDAYVVHRGHRGE